MPGARAIGGGYDDLVAQAVAKGRLAMLEPAVRARLLEGATVVQLPPRSLVAAGPAGIMLVVEGLMRAYVVARDGRQITVRYCWPGSLPGAASLYAVASPAIKNEALTATTLLMLRPGHVRAIAARDAAVANMLLLEIAERTVAYMSLIADTGLSSLRQRVVQHLFDLAAAAPGGPLVARLTQQELADHVGTVREVVARILRDMRERGLVETSREQITLADPAGLHAWAWPGNV
jgi:CRP/FNR family transcriptional regulator, cyclic AMP receptor protein